MLPLHEWFMSKVTEAPKQQRLLPLVGCCPPERDKKSITHFSCRT